MLSNYRWLVVSVLNSVGIAIPIIIDRSSEQRYSK